MDQSFSSQAASRPVQPKNWLVESILATIFCCLPFGIVGIVFAVQVNNKYAEGDYVGAEKASREAGKWTKISFFLGIAAIILSLIFVFALGGWAIMQGVSSDNY